MEIERGSPTIYIPEGLLSNGLMETESGSHTINLSAHFLSNGLKKNQDQKRSPSLVKEGLRVA
jgi:hypothetical protein